MEKKESPWIQMDFLLESLMNAEKQKLLSIGRRMVPQLTPDDLLQPNDYPILENHPEFRYQEGILAGFQSAQVALRALKKDSEK